MKNFGNYILETPKGYLIKLGNFFKNKWRAFKGRKADKDIFKIGLGGMYPPGPTGMCNFFYIGNINMTNMTNYEKYTQGLGAFSTPATTIETFSLKSKEDLHEYEACFDTCSYHSYISQDVFDSLKLELIENTIKADRPNVGIKSYPVCKMGIIVGGNVIEQTYGIMENNEYIFDIILGTRFMCKTKLRLEFIGKINSFSIQFEK